MAAATTLQQSGQKRLHSHFPPWWYHNITNTSSLNSSTDFQIAKIFSHMTSSSICWNSEFYSQTLYHRKLAVMSTRIILDAGWMRELRILQGTQARAQSDVQAHITFSRSHWRHCPTWNRTENRSKINLENVKTKWEWSKSLRVDIWISTTEQICTSMFTYCTNTFGLAAPCKHYIYTNKLQSAILSLATTSSPLFICVQGGKNVNFHVNIFVYELLTVKSTIMLKEALILKWYNLKRKLHSCYVELAYRVHRCLQISASFRSHRLDSKSSLKRCIPFYLDGIYWSCREHCEH